jgi:hypothetical protein
VELKKEPIFTYASANPTVTENIGIYLVPSINPVSNAKIL